LHRLSPIELAIGRTLRQGRRPPQPGEMAK
jgi:hypothetical protein